MHPLEPLVDLPRHRWSAVEITGARNLRSCGHSNYNFVSGWGHENCLKNMLAAALCILLLLLPFPSFPLFVLCFVYVRLNNVWYISVLEPSHSVWWRTFVVLWSALVFFIFFMTFWRRGLVVMEVYDGFRKDPFIALAPGYTDFPLKIWVRKIYKSNRKRRPIWQQ